MPTNLDLEEKCEKALIARLQQHPVLKDCNIKHSVTDSNKVDGSLIVRCQRGEENPSESGVFNVATEIEIQTRMQRGKNTLTDFKSKVRAMEEVLSLPWRQLVAELNACLSDFHCYNIAITDKDSTPEDDMHSCIWTCNLIAMPVSFETANKINSL